MSYSRKLQGLDIDNRSGTGAFQVLKYYKGLREINKNQYYNYVRKRLKKSVYPRQINDFFFLQMPEKLSKYKNYTKKEIPVDWLLKNIVLYFWNKGIMTQNLDQGSYDKRKEYNTDCFIRFYKSKKLINILKKLHLKYTLEDNYVMTEFNQKEILKINKTLNLEIPDIQESYLGNLVHQEWNEDLTHFKFIDYEDEFTGYTEYPVCLVKN